MSIRRYSLVPTLIALAMAAFSTEAQQLHPETGEVIPASETIERSLLNDRAPGAEHQVHGGGTLTLIKHLAGGETAGVAVEDDTLYSSNGGYFESIDVSNPASPEVLDRILAESSLVEDIWIEGDLAFVTSSRSNFPDGAGLRIIDISNPDDLHVIGEALGATAYGVTVSGGYAYVGGALSGLNVYSVSPPFAPSLVATLSVTDGSVLKTAVNGTTAYISAGNAGFATVDISDPMSPTLLDDITFGAFVTNVAHADTVAYVLVNGLGVVSLDVSDPSNLVQLDIFNIESSQIRGITLEGDTAYVTGNDGLVVLDVSDPADMTEIGSLGFPNTGSGQSIVLEGDQAFVGNRFDGVRVLDVADPTTPEETALIQNGGFSFKVFVQGDYAYVSDLIGEYRIIDISDPANAEIIGRTDAYPNTSNSTVRDGIAYVVDRGATATSGLTRFDVSVPENPTPIDTFATGNQSFGIDLDSDEAYIANGFFQFISVDISEPGNFSILDNFNPNSNAFDVRVQDNVAYVATFGGGLVTVDISDPSAMSQLNTTTVGGFLSSLALNDTLAYLADGQEGLNVVSIADPTEPQSLGIGGIAGIASGIAQSQDFAYIADEGFGLRQYDVTDPDNPIETAAVLSANRMTDVDTKDSLVVAVDAGGGVYLFTHPQPIANEPNPDTGALRLNAAHPNPFRNGTTIRYFLPESADVTLEVYDMLGRRVQTLVDSDLSDGWHDTRLNAENLSGGLYVIRLTAGAETLSRKVTLTR